MKKHLLLCTAALAVVLTGCNRSGMIDTTGSSSSASSPSASASSPVSSSSGKSSAGRKSAVPARIAHGSEVEIQDYVVPGKVTIFDFTSEGCPPCRAIAPHLHKLHAERSDIVVVEVDLNRPGVGGIDWDSPVAHQYGLQSIPAFKVYGTNGRLQAEGEAARDEVENLIKGQ
jgi:thiol-disulfide isomerase/thioredoxin